jgi:hypothetical protein
VTLHAVGRSDRNGPATLFVPEDQSMASLTDWTGGRVGAVCQRRCELRRLDDVIAASIVPAPDFIKCDIEGGELRAFIGAARLLDDSHAPVIFYEANARSAAAFGETISAATDFLRRQQTAAYSIFHVQGAVLAPIEQFRPDCDHYNLVAVPACRMERLAGLDTRST